MTSLHTENSFHLPVRVYYADTDAGGVVYHSTYYDYCERARTEWLRTLGIPGEVLKDEYGVIFVARRSSIEWKRPARLDDQLAIETRLSGIGKVRMTIRHTIRRDDVVLCVVDIEMVAVNLEFSPTALPHPLLERLPVAATIEENR